MAGMKLAISYAPLSGDRSHRDGWLTGEHAASSRGLPVAGDQVTREAMGAAECGEIVVCDLQRPLTAAPKSPAGPELARVSCRPLRCRRPSRQATCAGCSVIAIAMAIVETAPVLILS